MTRKDWITKFCFFVFYQAIMTLAMIFFVWGMSPYTFTAEALPTCFALGSIFGVIGFAFAALNDAV